MRLIDADKLKEYLDQKYSFGMDLKFMLFEEIDNQPTAAELIKKLNGHDSDLLDKVADMVLSLPKKYIDNFDYVACALILNGLKELKEEIKGVRQI